MVLDILQKPYVFALVLACLTAVLTYAYSKVTDNDAKKSNRTFFKTLAAGTFAGLGLTYLVQSKSDPIATEPFDPPAMMSGL